MKRQVDMNQISDGKFYGINDMVKADCNDCTGCSDCCEGMGNSIVLDPLDIFRLTKGLDCSFEELLLDKIELHVVDGVILPNLKMQGEREACAFLNEDGRCTIHEIRPGICRLFPLGRYYEEGSFRYFLQIHECRKENRTKVKVKKWIDTPQLKENEAFITSWHYFLNDVEQYVTREQNAASVRAINMYVLKQFFYTPYNVLEDFYEQFEQRLKEAKKIWNLRSC